MENNQHSNSGSAAPNSAERNSFSNNQPGQQLPAANSSNLDGASSDTNEQHSESSKPEKENETLGTP